MALGTFIVGRYTSTWNAVAIGLTKNGYRLSFEVQKALINQSDGYAKTIIDGIYQGVNVQMRLEGLEYAAGTTGPAWPYAALGVLGTVGVLDSGTAEALVLTSTAGTPAAAAPATLTANLAIVAENNNVEWLYSSELREVPLALRLYPYDVTGTIKFWTET